MRVSRAGLQQLGPHQAHIAHLERCTAVVRHASKCVADTIRGAWIQPATHSCQRQVRMESTLFGVVPTTAKAMSIASRSECSALTSPPRPVHNTLGERPTGKLPAPSSRSEKRVEPLAAELIAPVSVSTSLAGVSPKKRNVRCIAAGGTHRKRPGNALRSSSVVALSWSQMASGISMAAKRRSLTDSTTVTLA